MDYCKSASNCGTCPFIFSDGECGLERGYGCAPFEWDLPEKKVAEEMTPEEALEALNTLIIPRDGEQDRLADALEVAVKALESQIPKKIGYDYILAWEMAICPNCGFYRSNCHATWEMPFCPECGQKLDWNKEVSEDESCS